MKVVLTTELEMPAETAADLVLRSRLLLHVAAPLMGFRPLDPSELPDRWAEGRYLVQPRLFGWLPLGRQWIVISIVEEGPARYRVRDAGSGSLASTWDHLITIEPIEAARCRYTDEVDVKAGLLTPFVWLFAQIFYRHRQRRWRGISGTTISLAADGAEA